jgi:hypothetical protein
LSLTCSLGESLSVSETFFLKIVKLTLLLLSDMVKKETHMEVVE